ncbi:MAG TPA: NADH-quinone oxidoreductase subunit C, partial [Gemmataceae bacterium]|nr:NADH-quinone oxidoreductase subunit C [Gemmataceae bacterium]
MSSLPRLARVRNGQALPLAQVPASSIGDFRAAIIHSVAGGWRVASLFGMPHQADGSVALFAVLTEDVESALHLLKCTLEGDSFLSLTPECPQVHWFEREIAEQWGIRAEGHPWLKPIRFHKPYRSGHEIGQNGKSAAPVVGVTDFYRVEGEEVHEVAVGPVHAGVIEPGHFRFQCHGEHVFHLEISLG